MDDVYNINGLTPKKKKPLAPLFYIATDLGEHFRTLNHLSEQDAISEIVKKLDLKPGNEIVIVTLDDSIQATLWIFDKQRKEKFYTRVIVLNKKHCEIAKSFVDTRGQVLHSIPKLVKIINQQGIASCLFGNNKRGVSPILPANIKNRVIRRVWKFIQDKCAFFVKNSDIWWHKKRN